MKRKVYRCIEYRTSNKCNSFIILNDKMKILKYESQHNHLEKEYEASKSIVKHKIKETIRKRTFSLDIRPKRISNEISQDMGLICSEFNSIRIQIIRSQSKQLPPDITSFEEILEESEYYIKQKMVIIL